MNNLKKPNLIVFIAIWTLILFSFVSCGSKKAFVSKGFDNWQNEETSSDKGLLIRTTILIGDSGELDEGEDKVNFVVEAVSTLEEIKSTKTDIVFLGDNVYPDGLPEENSPERKISEAIIEAQIKPFLDSPSDIYFIPGNHDWNKHKPGGRDAIIRQENYIENSFKDQKENISFIPDNACGDPHVVKIGKDLVYVFIDSQWWLQDWSGEANINDNCKVDSREELLVKLDDIIAKNKNDHIIFMLHHPLRSNGGHGGYYSVLDHIFPTHEQGIWVPLPIIGSIYPMYKRLTGSEQDLTSSLNNELMSTLTEIATRHRAAVTFVSGHEHGLQYFDEEKIKFIVSGSAGKTDYLKKGGNAGYINASRGFALIKTYDTGESWVEFYTVIPSEGSIPKLDFKAQLRKPRKGTEKTEITYLPVIEKDTTFVSNPEFGAGAIKHLLLGETYRNSWSKDMTVPIIDLENFEGGLTPIKVGGGMSSHSLRLETDEGKHYILRSMNKVYNRALPEKYKDLKALNVVREMNTSIYPYASLTLPTLSKAANIYYTNPQLVYLKRQESIGAFAQHVPEGLYSLEERPNGNWEGYEPFGGSKDIIGYSDLLKKLKKKKNHHVDQKWVLRSRLFDFLIHDWDRHEDQWRWATFKEEDKTIYRPIPRDRDFTYFRFDGIVSKVIAQFVFKNFRTMKGDLNNITNQALNATHFDRSFLNELDWTDWEREIEYLQTHITTEVIDLAFSNLPKQEGNNYNEEIKQLLKERITELEKGGRKYYQFLNRELEIIGTDNKDEFNIEILSPSSLVITHVVKSNKSGEIVKYKRKIDHQITKEIRIYGFNDDDQYNIVGDFESKIKIRIIGGEGDGDKIINLSQTKVLMYDQNQGISAEGEVVDHTSIDHKVNNYDRFGFKYNTSFPLLNFGSSRDDGFFFGGGLTWTKHEWRADPYKSLQTLTFSVAPQGREALILNYNGIFPDLIGKFNFNPKVDVSFPRYENFFGLGNESLNLRQDDVEFNWVKLQTAIISPMLSIGTPEKVTFGFGPLYETHRVDQVDGRVGDDPDIGGLVSDDSRFHYLGGTLSFLAEFKDRQLSPSSGFNFLVRYKELYNIGESENVREFESALTFYYQIFSRPELILANKFGYIHTGGDLQFHQYADLGNSRNLRGFRNERFRGQKAFYQNIDLRMHLFEWNNVWFPVDIGLTSGFDYGRVWLNGESSGSWHSSVSIGAWFNFFDLILVHPYYSIVDSDEPNQFTLRLGFGL